MKARDSGGWAVLCLGLLVACGSKQPDPNTPANTPRMAPASALPAATEAKHQLLVNLGSGFTVRERSATSTIILETGKERLLEIHKFEGQGCSDDLIPRVGPNTATTKAEIEKKARLDYHWFTQRSSIEHAPFTSVGFYICSSRSFLLIRYVGPEAAIKDAKGALLALLENRNIVIE